jgi:hypothetical protein
MHFLKPYSLLLAGAVLLGLSSCSTSSFYPSSNNFAPMVQEKGEVKVQGGLSIYANTLGYDLKAAYGITDHLEVLASTSSLSPAPESQNDWNPNTGALSQPNGMRGNQTELGLGFTAENDVLSYEITGGYGFLGGSTYGSNNELKHDFRAGRFFLQPAAGYRGDFAELIFSMRFTSIRFPEISTDTLVDGNNTGQNFFDFDNVPAENSRGYLFLEPAGSLLLGGNQLKFKMQVGFAIPLQNDQLAFNYEGSNVQIGVVYNFRPSTADQGFMGLDP